MNYFVIVYAIFNDGRDPKKAIYDAENEQDAKNQFHGYLSTYGRDESVDIALVQAQNLRGSFMRSELIDKIGNATVG